MNVATTAEHLPNETRITPLFTHVATVLPLAQPGNFTQKLVPAQRKCEVTVTPCRLRGQPGWRVRYWENGVKRAWKASKTLADALAIEKRGDALTSRKRLELLPPVDQDWLMQIFNEVERHGLDRITVLASLRGLKVLNKQCPAAEAILSEFLAEKRAANKDEGYVKNLNWALGTFIRGREKMPLDTFTTAEVVAFIQSKSPGYRRTLRPKLFGLFGFAKRLGYLTENPCDGMPRITVRRKAAEVFHVEEAEACLKWLVKHPTGMAWFVLTAFAGLRPEDEAYLTRWEHINFDKQFIVVEAERCKTGRRRVVYPPAMVFEWLAWAKANGAKLPLCLNAKVQIQRALRGLLKWAAWKKDVTRHSAASYWLAWSDDVKLVSRALGNSITILESHYDARVLKEAGEAYYGLTPRRVAGG